MSDNTNWGQSVAGVVIREGKVLLARHTYGGGKGKLIIPGGYVNIGESPQDALIREFMEETAVTVKPKSIIGIRFNMHDWYIVFSAEYVSGEARPDNDENSEVLWLDAREALTRDDVPELTKKMIESALADSEGLELTEYNADLKHTPRSLYSLIKKHPADKMSQA